MRMSYANFRTGRVRQIPRWHRRCFQFGAVLFALGCHDISADQFVKVEAELQILEVKWLEPEPSAKSQVRPPSTNEWKIAFSAIVGTKEWRLEGNFSRNSRDCWLFDGTNVLNSIRMTGPAESANHGNTNGPGLLGPALSLSSSDETNMTINIHVTPGGYLPGDASQNIPWLALCSGSFLKRSGRTIPYPVAILGHSPDSFAYTDKTQVFDDELGLPRKIELFTSESLYSSSAREDPEGILEGAL